MTPDEFGGDGVNNATEVEMALFFSQTSVKDLLQLKVAQLIAKVSHIVALDGVEHFIRFFDCIRRYGLKVLRQVPRATRNGRSERRHDGEKVVDIV